jgi:hypothetical protein
MNHFKIPQGNEWVSIPGRIGLTILFFFFFGLGSIFMFLLGREVIKTVDSYRWQPVSATIRTAEVNQDDRSDDNPYVFEVTFWYTYQGQEYHAEQFSTTEERFSDYTKAARLLDQYAPGTATVSYVNPHHPAQAILKHRSLWFGFFALLPLIFILIGLCGIVGTWQVPVTRSISGGLSVTVNREKRKDSPMSAFVLWAVFFLIGLGFLYGLLIRPWVKVQEAKSWPEVSCTILSSQVRTHDSDDGTTYSVDILYAYEWNGRTYKSNRYQFLGGSSSGYRAKADTVSDYPEGSSRICFVNPQDPTQAVLNRNFPLGMYIGGGIGLLFIFLGLGGMMGMIRSPFVSGIVSSKREARIKGLEGPVVLNPKHGPVMRLAIMLLITLFLDGILIFIAFEEMGADPSWGDFLKIFFSFPLVIFFLLGGGLWGLVVYFLMAALNPRPRIILDSLTVPLGGKVAFQWEINGALNRLQNLRIYLEGREVAIYKRGTRTYTDTHAFFIGELVHLQSGNLAPMGHSALIIPSDTMHSFESLHNKIRWYIVIHGEIPRWADMKEEFEFVVLAVMQVRGVDHG